MTTRGLTVAERVERLTRRDPPGEGCWEWLGAINPQTGYGVMKIGGRSGKLIGAHRVSWEVANGREVPNGLHVLHRCDNRKCVRPDHLFIGTHGDNMRDMAAKGRGGNEYSAMPRTHCKREHEFSIENTRIGSHGQRVCRQCAALWAREHRKARKAAL